MYPIPAHGLHVDACIVANLKHRLFHYFGFMAFSFNSYYLLYLVKMINPHTDKDNGSFLNTVAHLTAEEVYQICWTQTIVKINVRSTLCFKGQ